MSRGPAVPPRAGVGRADLLRALAVADRERLALEDAGGTWFGYVRGEKASDLWPAGWQGMSLGIPTISLGAPPPKPGPRLPLKMPALPAVAWREAIPAAATVPSPPRQPAEALDPAGPDPSFRPCAVRDEDLIPEARLLPALCRWLGALRTGPLDLERFARDLASGTPPRYLPRRQVRRWHPGLVVALDFSARLWPYREDMHRLAERLLRQCGRSRVSLRILDRGPAGGWTDWLAAQDPSILPERHLWTLLPAGTPVLIVGDLGLLLGAASGPAQAWAAFAGNLARAGLRPLALAPLGAAQLDGALAQTLPILRWSPDARPHPERAHGAGAPIPEGLAELLALAAVPRRVDPPLLRALRRLLPLESLNAGLEGAFWCHADVLSGFAAELRGDRRDVYLHRFRELSADVHRALERLRDSHHAHLPEALIHEELLAFASHADSSVLTDPTLAQRLAAAEHFLERLAATPASAGAGRGGGWRAVARAIVARADPAMYRRHGALLLPLLADRVREERARGLEPDLPEGVDLAQLAPHLKETGGEPVPAWLVRDAESGCILLQPRPPGPRQSPMGEALRIDGAGVRVVYPSVGGSGPAAGRPGTSADPRRFAGSQALAWEPGPGSSGFPESRSREAGASAAPSPSAVSNLPEELELGPLWIGSGEDNSAGSQAPAWEPDAGSSGFPEPRGREAGASAAPFPSAVSNPPEELLLGPLWMGPDEDNLKKALAALRVFTGSQAPVWQPAAGSSGFPELPGREAGASPTPFPSGAWERAGKDFPVPSSSDNAQSHHRRSRLYFAGQLPVTLETLDEPAHFSLETSTEWLGVQSVRRPRGAASWACGGQGITLTSPELADQFAEWPGRSLTPASNSVTGSGEDLISTLIGPSDSDWVPHASVNNPAIRFGLDPFGVHADLTLTTEHCTATQRFRYIEPGSFLMGSPNEETEGLAQKDNEKEWFEREHPRHPVTLTQGFWLADTACTQALWQAVMGDNPSRFQSPDRPVERVSWTDVQGFLRKLEGLLPGVRADLPTEAEWEYACRAGTETAVYTGPIEILGANNAPALDIIAWYGGNSGVEFDLDNGYDSSGWPDRQYPDSPSGTHPVGQKQPNTWGLYDLLGNVWEWCADPLRDYADEPAVNPVGDAGGERSPRAVRGGSWDDYARGVRSAFRNWDDPGNAGGDLGFRLCLRSIEPGPVRPGGTPAGAPGGRPGSSPSRRDGGRAAGAERPRRVSSGSKSSRKKKP